MYNPFTPLTASILQQLIVEGNRFWVVQRFSWPGISPNKGFLLSSYVDRADAEVHRSELESNEGKLLNAFDDLDKVLELLEPRSGFRLFLNRIKEKNWNKRMLTLYQGKIVAYLKSRTSFKRNDSIEILFTLVNGRVMAVVTGADKKIEVVAYELIK